MGNGSRFRLFVAIASSFPKYHISSLGALAEKRTGFWELWALAQKFINILGLKKIEMRDNRTGILYLAGVSAPLRWSEFFGVTNTFLIMYILGISEFWLVDLFCVCRFPLEMFHSETEKVEFFESMLLRIFIAWIRAIETHTCVSFSIFQFRRFLLTL